MNLQTLATTQKTNKQKTTDFSQPTQRNKEKTQHTDVGNHKKNTQKRTYRLYLTDKKITNNKNTDSTVNTT